MTNSGEPYIEAEQTEDEYVVHMHMSRTFMGDTAPSLIIEKIIYDLAQKYIDEHGGELLKAITPEQIQRAIEQEVAKRFFTKDDHAA